MARTCKTNEDEQAYLIEQVGAGRRASSVARELGISDSAAGRIIARHRRESANPYFGRSEGIAAKRSFLQNAGIEIGRGSILEHLSREAVELLVRECAREGYSNVTEAVADLAVEYLMQQREAKR